MAKGMLIDVTKCMGCRACQVACKEWNDLPAETTACFGCYDNPEDLSAITLKRNRKGSGNLGRFSKKHPQS